MLLIVALLVHPATSAAAATDPQEELLAFGDAPFLGSTRPLALSRPTVGLAAHPASPGYWVVGADGGIFAFGAARFLGSTGGLRLDQPVVGMAATPTGRGYWLVASDGGIFAYGDAAFLGSTGGTRLDRPIVGMVASPTGRGYRLVASDGGVFAYGDAAFLGSTGGTRLDQRVVGVAGTATGGGYWLVASDGGVFAFGDAAFLGSTGGTRPVQPVVGVAATPTGRGYWMAAADGAIFSFGDAGYQGGANTSPLAGVAVGLAPTTTGRGYWMAVRRTVVLPGAPASWVLADRSTGQSLLEHRADERRRPASTSKMLTALVAVRRLPRGATVPISARAAGVVPTEAGARQGEVWSLDDALHGLLLPSGNDLAFALAERVSGSVEAFGPQMQAVSNELGLSSSSTWRDPAGLDAPSLAVGGGNWSTARDLSRLGRAVVDDPLLSRIVDTASYTYRGPYGVPHTVSNSNRLLTADPTVFGIKTGTTAAAGQCLVAAASRSGRQVVTVVLGATDRYAATAALLNRTP